MSLQVTGFPFDLNGYKFLECIGCGTYSTAFKVFSIQYQQYFCAKMTEINDDFFDSEGNPRDPELNALLMIDNPNVIKVYKYFRYDDFFFLILELCNAGTLADVLNTAAQLPVELVFSFMIDILEALVYCHSQNIAHRDIKPQNIFIDEQSHAKVADFGLSSILVAHQCLVDTACGSPSYAAPEIYGNKAYDPFKADVFALGVTFYQMLTRSLPWPDEITTAGPARPPPIYPRILGNDMTALLKQMLHTDPQSRPTMETILHSDVFNNAKLRIDSMKNRAAGGIRQTTSFRTQSKENMHPPSMSSPSGQKFKQHPLLTASYVVKIGKKRRNSARIQSKELTFSNDI